MLDEDELDKRLSDLERRERQNHQVLVAIQNALRIAANYKNDDINTLVAGIQAALEIASKAQARPNPRGKKYQRKEPNELDIS